MRAAPIALLLAAVTAANASELSYGFYDPGTPATTELWVDPIAGDDNRGGANRGDALRTLTAAWQRIPQATALDTGFRIRITPGPLGEAEVPVYFESRWGSYDHPVMIEAADGPGTVTLPALNIYDARYLYLLDLVVSTRGGDVLHCERCDHLLLKRLTVRGNVPWNYDVQEVVKINQSQHVYIEESDFGGGWDNALDFVGVQYGHVLKNRIHDAGDWCQYVKGGSAHVVVAGNEYFDCGTGGFSAGQGSGFEFMVPPWLHYEAYDIKFVNNLVHDTEGAGMGVNGGYNILLAHNTLYRVGSRSHMLEVVYGYRSCDGGTATCAAHLAMGGWGTTDSSAPEGEPIPNRNVYIYNNLLYNPAGFESSRQLVVYGPRTPGAGSNLPAEVSTDGNLQIRGNLFWNGGPDTPLGTGDEGDGCRDGNPTCNPAQLRTENRINEIEPQLVNPAGGDFRPVAGGNLAGVTTYAPPDFGWADAPATPPVPTGNPANTVVFDRLGSLVADATPGAFTLGSHGDHDRVLNWAERVYADLLRPGGGGSLTYDGYYYRHYSGSGAYVGIRDGRAWYMGPASGGGMIDVGPFAGYLERAGAAGY